MYLSTLQGQQVSDKNWTLIHERTADWCPFCGTWGWDLKTQMMNKFANDEVIFMAVHHSGGLSNPTAVEFGDNFGGSGQPIFFVDGVNINANGGNIATKLDETQLEVDFKNTVATIAGVGINANLSKTTNTLTVDAKVEFFNDVENGDYYLGLYLLEDVMNTQASRTGLQLHKNVLRQKLLTSTFGNPLQKGAVAKGTTFTVNTTVPGITADRDKIKVVGIIWNKVNNKYLFFNANQVNVGIPATSEEFTAKSSFNAYQAESGNIVVEIPETFNEKVGTISVIDASGRTLETAAFVANSKSININSYFVPGMHVIMVVSGNQKISRKLIIQ